MKEKNPGLPYAEREWLLAPDVRAFDASWSVLARRCAPDMPVAEAVAAFKELHAAGLVELVRERDGTSRRRCCSA